MIVNILSHTPVWVWGLLAALTALGFSQTRQRHVAEVSAGSQSLNTVNQIHILGEGFP